MHPLRFSALAAILVVASSLVATPVAKATNGATTATGAACQPVTPGSNDKLAFKATGIRNESTTTSSFVVCPLPSTVTFGSNAFTDIWLQVYSIDGASHEVTCTAVTGFLLSVLQYSSKTSTVSGANQAVLEWTAADFGGSAGQLIGNSNAFSMTCLLPPQTLILAVNGWFQY
ncbi:MAG: hypothetical protein QM719_06310 [Thermomonas sp.]